MTLELPDAILFDMDGTLTEPVFDFPGIHRAMGIPPGEPILEYLKTMPEPKRLSAELILHEIEDQIAATAPLAESCHELLAFARERGIRLGLITRNRRASLETFLKRHSLRIQVCISREDAPHKPDPSGLLRTCAELKVSPANTWMVGDGEFDILAGHNAGMRTVWFHHGRERTFSAVPWLSVRNLQEFAHLIGIRS